MSSGKGAQEQRCPRLLLGDGLRVSCPAVLRCPMLLFQRFSRCLFSLQLAVRGLSHAKAFLFSPPRLHQAHKMCENVTFSLSACFRLRSPPPPHLPPHPCLFCRAREEALSLVCSGVCF